MHRRAEACEVVQAQTCCRTKCLPVLPKRHGYCPGVIVLSWLGRPTYLQTMNIVNHFLDLLVDHAVRLDRRFALKCIRRELDSKERATPTCVSTPNLPLTSSICKSVGVNFSWSRARIRSCLPSGVDGCASWALREDMNVRAPCHDLGTAARGIAVAIRTTTMVAKWAFLHIYRSNSNAYAVEGGGRCGAFGEACRLFSPAAREGKLPKLSGCAGEGDSAKYGCCSASSAVIRCAGSYVSRRCNRSSVASVE